MKKKLSIHDRATLAAMRQGLNPHTRDYSYFVFGYLQGARSERRKKR